MPYDKLLIATSNAGKVREIAHEFNAAWPSAHPKPALLGLKDLPTPIDPCIEDRPTFVGNAAKKARHYAQLAGMLTLADDSGLCVDALAGAPGVYSARYAGVDGPDADAANNAKLLREMDRVDDAQRHARFVCAMALALPNADLAVMVEDVRGTLLRSPRGTNGFGYDPLFFIPAFNRTTAELDMSTKNSISHRGKAIRRMIAWFSSAGRAPIVG
jgi:XTP/dITP diphosphohydrolase